MHRPTSEHDRDNLRRVLVVEDDVAIRRGVIEALRHVGFDAIGSGDGVTGLEMALDPRVELLLLDLTLPRRDGLDVLQTVRNERPGLAVILITARGSEDERVTGLRLGADDYVVKPFSVRELLARVEAVLRRSPERAELGAPELHLPDRRVDLAASVVQHRDGTSTELTELETRLLRYLADRGDRLVSRDELLTHVWQLDPRHTHTRAVDVAVGRLRRKLRDDEGTVLKTKRGRGYRWTGRTIDPDGSSA
ncbi:MAG: response regulator transcription factor [Thermoanaerobaculia bacterium]|nr:response regulator transcription factor [Thermoanaerobaculia bacterium]